MNTPQGLDFLYGQRRARFRGGAASLGHSCSLPVTFLGAPHRAGHPGFTTYSTRK